MARYAHKAVGISSRTWTSPISASALTFQPLAAGYSLLEERRGGAPLVLTLASFKKIQIDSCASNNFLNDNELHRPKGLMQRLRGVSGCEQKTLLSNKKTPFLRIQTGGGCEGLRSQNAVDSLHLRPSRGGAKLTPRLAKREAPNSRPAVICGKGMSLVFVSIEMAPWSKTGALGDAHGGLPAAMAANGHIVMAIAPRYDQYKDGWDPNVTIEVCLAA